MNWWRFAALVLSIGIAAAFWGAVFNQPVQGREWLMPPERFDHEPVMPYEVRYRSVLTFEFYCGTNHPWIGGCTVFENGVCFITVRADLGDGDRADVLRHEKGHCNGWPANHSP